MRYAYGIFIGAILPFMCFLGGAVILIQSLPWDIYFTWFIVSIGIGVFPPVLVFFANRDVIRKFLIFETGGFGLFSPLWIVLFADITGTSWTTLFTEGIIGGLPSPGLGPSIIRGDISSEMLVLIFISCIILGLVFLRPSFIEKYGVKGEMAELRDLKKSAEPTPKPAEPSAAPETLEADPIEADMPEVAAPKANVDTMADLRGLLTELGTPEPTINLIFNSGIATTTELVATSPEQLATLTGIDKRTAEDLHMAVQKKVWFGDI
ncbi:MAG: helix-hairpin-helix domain-containing protein [Candidatus Thorarchaeota archaeon]